LYICPLRRPPQSFFPLFSGFFPGQEVQQTGTPEFAILRGFSTNRLYGVNLFLVFSQKSSIPPPEKQAKYAYHPFLSRGYGNGRQSKQPASSSKKKLK
jgi:hypothetical protein